ncbi:MAG: YARHG domain-containing protein [Clostridiales bacterium]|nr:YARHG domain-containing protein [Clostridiales bacterium]
MKKCPICGKEYTEGSTCTSCGVVLIDLESSQAVNVVQEQKEQREKQKQDLRDRREQEKQQKLEQRREQAAGADRTPVQSGMNPRILILIVVVVAVVIICLLVAARMKNKNSSNQTVQEYTQQTDTTYDEYTDMAEDDAEDITTDEVTLNEKDFADTEWQTWETDLFIFSLPAYWDNLCNSLTQDSSVTFYQARSQAAGYDGTLFTVTRIFLADLSEYEEYTVIENDETYAYIILYPDYVMYDDSDEYTVLEYERLLEDVSVIRSSFEVTVSDSDYIIEGSDSRYLDKSELVDLSAEELKYARNEIYARHGRRFQDETIQAYFDSKEWYNGTIEPEDFTQSMLNDYEIANASLILEYEQEMGYVN